jgi:hypothetical protein
MEPTRADLIAFCYRPDVFCPADFAGHAEKIAGRPADFAVRARIISCLKSCFFDDENCARRGRRYFR